MTPGAGDVAERTFPPRRERWRRGAPVVVVGCVITLAVAVVPMRSWSGDGDAPSALMCATANDYAWYLNELAGAYGSPPTPERVEELVTGEVDHANLLLAQVPWSRRDDARIARKTWEGADCVFARYDYGQNGDVPDRFGTELRETVGSYRESNQRFVSWMVDGCAPEQGRWPTPPPGVSDPWPFTSPD